MIQSSPNGTATMGKPWADHGHSHTTTPLQTAVKTTADQNVYRERTTGFEPATLTLAKKRLWFPSAESVPVPYVNVDATSRIAWRPNTRTSTTTSRRP
jgi:hypothetical protein